MLADIALYAYTHAAEENGLSLSRHPSIQKWSSRIEAVPGFRAMGHAGTPLGLSGGLEPTTLIRCPGGHGRIYSEASP
jgi:hypothetical protein